MGDEESIYPDTSSMTDLAQLSRSLQGLKLQNSQSEWLISKQSTTETLDVGSMTNLPNDNAIPTIYKSQSDRLKSSSFVMVVNDSSLFLAA